MGSIRLRSGEPWEQDGVDPEFVAASFVYTQMSDGSLPRRVEFDRSEFARKSLRDTRRSGLSPELAEPGGHSSRWAYGTRPLEDIIEQFTRWLISGLSWMNHLLSTSTYWANLVPSEPLMEWINRRLRVTSPLFEAIPKHASIPGTLRGHLLLPWQFESVLPLLLFCLPLSHLDNQASITIIFGFPVLSESGNRRTGMWTVVWHPRPLVSRFSPAAG